MIDVVMITTATRGDLLEQSIRTVRENTSNPIRLTIVVNSAERTVAWSNEASTTSILTGPVGASAARNIGAGSIPRYRRGSHVLFLDDDVYMCSDFDERMIGLSSHLGDRYIVSGYSHPFNHAESVYEPHNIDNGGIHYGRPLVISSVCMMMPWSIFDEVGPWDEPGGPGGSEDYAICMRAKAKGYGFAVTEPQCCIHTGLRSSTGKPIVGYDQLVAQNEKLIQLYGLEGKVKWK